VKVSTLFYASCTHTSPAMRQSRLAAAADVAGLRYTQRHYDTNPCAGLGTSGNVCPVRLDCEQRLHTDRNTTKCAVQMLPGLGFNPSIVPAPESVQQIVLRLGTGAVKYVATNRFEANNNRVRCLNPVMNRGGMRRRRGSRTQFMTSTELLLLGRNFEVWSCPFCHGEKYLPRVADRSSTGLTSTASVAARASSTARPGGGAWSMRDCCSAAARCGRRTPTSGGSRAAEGTSSGGSRSARTAASCRRRVPWQPPTRIDSGGSRE
jgi:hypothetical protein